MKSAIVLGVIVVLVILFGLFFSSSSESILEEDNGSVNEEDTNRENSNSDGLLDMQGYYLDPPSNYDCVGGFTDGYRYLDAVCTPKGQDDHVINVGAGLASSGINWDEGRLVANQIVARSFEFTGGQYGVTVCEEFHSEDLELGGEYYICFYNANEGRTLTIGVGKSFLAGGSAYGRWFEADLVINVEEGDYSEEDHAETLAKFLNDSVKIDWSDYAPESL